MLKISLVSGDAKLEMEFDPMEFMRKSGGGGDNSVPFVEKEEAGGLNSGKEKKKIHRKDTKSTKKKKSRAKGIGKGNAKCAICGKIQSWSKMEKKKDGKRYCKECA